METMYCADQEIMKRFVWRRLYPDEMSIVLAQGGDGEGTVWAHIVPLGDDPRVGIDLEVTTNLPEYVTLQEIYDYYRRQDMTCAELKERIANDIAASRYKELVARGTQLFAEHSGITPYQVEGNRAHVQVDVEDETVEGDVTLPPCDRFEFRLVGDIWLLRFMTEEGHFRNLDGFCYIATLLARPEKSIEAIELQGRQDSPADYSMKPQYALEGISRQDLEAAVADLEQAISQESDPACIVELKEEHKKLSASLRESKYRRLDSSPREKARKAVANAIGRAIKLIEESMPEFAKFLNRSILPDGTARRYSPAPPAPKWVLVAFHLGL